MAVTRPDSPRRERFTLTEERFRLIAYAALITLTAIIFTGAAVRLTGSGLGCSDWPRCEDGRLLPELSTHAMIEYGNRMMTSVVGIPSLLAAIGAYRLRPFRRDLVRPALILPLGVLAQAVLGGFTVLFDLSWEMVIAHYLVSIVLLIAAAVLVWRVNRRRDDPAPVNPPEIVRPVWGLAAFGLYVIVAGTFATAAGPHAGGAGTGDYVARLDAFGIDTLRNLIHLHGHSATAMGIAAVALWFWARRRRATEGLRRTLTVVCWLMALQGALGLIQYHSELPAGIVWVHTSLAAVLWIALVWAVLQAGRSSGSGTSWGGRPSPSSSQVS